MVATYPHTREGMDAAMVRAHGLLGTGTLTLYSSRDDLVWSSSDEDEVKLITSAESLFSASSKDNFVLVLFSKKIFAIVKCLNDWTFLIGLDRTSLNILVVSKINSISSIDKSFIPSKCLDFSLFIIGYPYIIFFKTLFG